jgi:nucleoside-diphosphate-sugar epimerase
VSHVCVPGGAGYVGAVLVPKLLARGHRVTVLDNYQFGREVFANVRGAAGLREVEGDVRDQSAVARALDGCDAVVHLACVSNDPSFELDPDLARTINYDCFPMFVEEAKKAGVRRFIYASSSSVYGVSDAPDVTEDHPLLALTDYSKYKALCEPIVLDAGSANFTALVLRPATVCGVSNRMRFDLSVNILTNLAIQNRKITVFGGAQLRPNLHIEDVTDLYESLLLEPAARISGKTFNAGYQNRSIADLATVVKSVVEREFPENGAIEIVTTPTDDLRSYRVNSDRIATELGFAPRYSIEDAVRDICRWFRAGRFPRSLEDERYFNVRLLKMSEGGRVTA